MRLRLWLAMLLKVRLFEPLLLRLVKPRRRSKSRRLELNQSLFFRLINCQILLVLLCSDL
jgi:hypothetical protein